MTTLTRKIVRLTNAKHRGDQIVIELHATAVLVRTKGSRKSFPITYSDLYEVAASEAKRKTARTANSRTTR